MTSILQELNAGSRGPYRRRFVLEGLPEGMTAADPHLQIFDNYIEKEGLHLRKVRKPETSELVFMLMKNYGGGNCERKEAVFLSEAEYRLFKGLLGREIRLNRYLSAKLPPWSFVDVFLGQLSGLFIQTIEFENFDKRSRFDPQFRFFCEISDDGFFDGELLVSSSFEAVRRYLTKKKAVD